jgi:nucleoside-diphosphate-sugar epimerase
MRVLVTGNLGYIGCILTPMLSERGHDVAGLDSDLFASCTFHGVVPRVPTLLKDIRDVEVGDLRGFDAVIHLAGLSNDPLGDLNPELTMEVNHLASVRLAKLAREAGVRRFLFSSSCSTYGAAGDDLIDESAAFNPVTPYGRSKVLAEEGISPLATSRFTPVFLRNATAYGLSPRLRFDLVLNNLVAWAYSTGRIFLKSDGTPWRPIVHIEDISRAFIAALEAPAELVHNRAFNVAVENFRISELAAIVGEIVPGCRIDYADGAGPDKRCYCVDGGLIHRTLPAFVPRWTARRGAQELYAAYRDTAITPDDFEGPRYKRIDHLKMLIQAGRVDQTLRSTGRKELHAASAF